jgi:hypothetical protein
MHPHRIEEPGISGYQSQQKICSLFGFKVAYRGVNLAVYLNIFKYLQHPLHFCVISVHPVYTVIRSRWGLGVAQVVDCSQGMREALGSAPRKK